MTRVSDQQVCVVVTQNQFASSSFFSNFLLFSWNYVIVNHHRCWIHEPMALRYYNKPFPAYLAKPSMVPWWWWYAYYLAGGCIEEQLCQPVENASSLPILNFPAFFFKKCISKKGCHTYLASPRSEATISTTLRSEIEAQENMRQGRLAHSQQRWIWRSWRSSGPWKERPPCEPIKALDSMQHRHSPLWNVNTKHTKKPNYEGKEDFWI